MGILLFCQFHLYKQKHNFSISEDSSNIEYSESALSHLCIEQTQFSPYFAQKCPCTIANTDQKFCLGMAQNVRYFKVIFQNFLWEDPQTPLPKKLYTLFPRNSLVGKCCLRMAQNAP